MACVFLASCGGGGDSGSEAPAPAPAPANYNVELYTGKTAVDYKKCDLVGDTLQTAGYFNLSKIAVYKDSIELLESFENCSDKDYYFCCVYGNSCKSKRNKKTLYVSWCRT